MKILREGGPYLANAFRYEPLRMPVDPQFAPYYEQVLLGHAEAILRYCDQHWEQGNLGSSFFEMVGRLYLLKFYRAADVILGNIAGRRNPGWPSAQSTYGHWYQKLKALCVPTRKWIKIESTLIVNPHKKREILWGMYIARPGWNLTSKRDCADHKTRQESIKDCLDEIQEAQHNSESGQLISEVNKLAPFHLVPRKVFDDLALTNAQRFIHTPSWVARKYACLIVGVSESRPSHPKTWAK